MVWAKNINLSQCKTAGWKIQLTAKKDVPVGATIATIQCVSVQMPKGILCESVRSKRLHRVAAFDTLGMRGGQTVRINFRLFPANL